MSTSEALFDGRFAKRLVTVSGLVPAALLVWDAYHEQLGVNHVNFAIRTTGMVGLVLLVLSLLVVRQRQKHKVALGDEGSLIRRRIINDHQFVRFAESPTCRM